MIFGGDDIRIVGDIVIGSLLASVLRRGLVLVVMKAFVEPAAVVLGQWGYRRADAMAGDRLPNFFQAKGE